MKKFFDIKRTKMTDDAAYRHKPVTVGKTVLVFILVSFIASIISSLIPMMVESAFTFSEASKSGLLDAYTAAAKAGNAEAVDAILTEIFASATMPWWLIVVELSSLAFVIGTVIF